MRISFGITIGRDFFQWYTILYFEMMNLCIKNDEFCIKSDECCINNDEFCIKNDEFCIKNDEFWKANSGPGAF